MKKILIISTSLFVVLLLSGCANNVYYAGMEKIGFHKRDIMVDRVKNVQESQEDAQEEFKSALEQFGTLVQIKDSDLKSAYEKFNDEYEEVSDASEELSNNINKLENVSLALFQEWENELTLYKNQQLKAQSKKNLDNTKSKYRKMMKSMRTSEKSMKPILDTFRDNVLILKHSLNAQAIGSLQGKFGELKKDISTLISKMNQSIKDSNIFIKEMN